jgi:hypothetical protein
MTTPVMYSSPDSSAWTRGLVQPSFTISLGWLVLDASRDFDQHPHGLTLAPPVALATSAAIRALSSSVTLL